MEHDFSVLPPELIETILLRLPAKSLIRFKAVCNSWNTIISEPRFACTHIDQSRSSYSPNLFIHKYLGLKGFSLLELKGGEFQTLENFDEPYHWTDILCFYNGMLLLGNHPSRDYGLWNPSTRTLTKFRFPYEFDDADQHSLSYGICSDWKSDDFKVIFHSRKFYAVFSCKNEMWLEKKDYEYSQERYSVVCAHDAVYWITIVEGEAEVTYYDIDLDEFFILCKPGSVEKSKPIYIVELGRYLCLYCNGRDEKTVQIWKLDDCWRWEEWLTIENVTTSIHCFKPLCLVEAYKIMIMLEETRLVVYSPSAKTYEEFEDMSLFRFKLVPYVESLIMYSVNVI